MPPNPFLFIGKGTLAELKQNLNIINPIDGKISPWQRGEDDIVESEQTFGHPAGYITSTELAEAVNTSLILRKPLLLTGNPGTGKSELAERIAWEFNLGPVLRFEAQSLSEAGDLFYRFDLVGQMAAANLSKHTGRDADIQPEHFISFGPLGKAILRSAPEKRYEDLFRIAFPSYKTGELPKPRPTVVLIDEIDKASRDFPNDLLNGIERLEFRLRELHDRTVKVADDEDLKPIVIITSNSERDLPGPFLRRCTYFHIADPDINLLRDIVRNRVFPESSLVSGNGPQAPALPKLYEDLLGFFVDHRKQQLSQFAYEPSASELIDWAKALKQGGKVNQQRGLAENLKWIRNSTSAVAKNKDDRERLLTALQAFKPA